MHSTNPHSKEKTQQKQPLQTVNSKNVVWQHIWSICLLRKYSCCPGDTAGYWWAWPLDGPSRGTPRAATAALEAGLEILLFLLSPSPPIIFMLWTPSSCTGIYLTQVLAVVFVWMIHVTVTCACLRFYGNKIRVEHCLGIFGLSFLLMLCKTLR